MFRSVSFLWGCKVDFIKAGSIMPPSLGRPWPLAILPMLRSSKAATSSQGWQPIDSLHEADLGATRFGTGTRPRRRLCVK